MTMMQKMAVIVLLLNGSIVSSGRWLSSELIEAIKGQKEGYQQLLPHLHNIEVKRSSHDSYSWDYCHGSRHHRIEAYTYDFNNSAAAKKAYKMHQETLAQFTNAEIKSAVGDGLMLGVLITCLGRSINKEKRFQKTAIAALISALLLAIRQTDVIGEVPYVSAMLHKEKTGYLTTLLTRFIGIGLGALLGICGTTYALDRTEELLAPVE